MSDVTATGDVPAQDVATRVEDALYGGEPKNNDDVAIIDEQLADLPKVDDADSDDEGSKDLDKQDLDIEEDITLAGYLGIDEDRIVVADDGGVLVKAKIDGEVKQVPIGELVSSYQTMGHANNKSMALESERKEFEKQRQEAAGELKQRLDGIESLGKVIEDQLMSDYNQIDWNRLKTEDPTQWAVLRQEFADKASSIQQIQQKLHDEGKKQLELHQSEFQTKRNEHLASEVKKMIADNPTWSDASVFASETGKLRGFLSESYGFSNEDFKQVTDHRMIKLIKDAHAYRSGSTTAKEKLVKKSPRIAKPTVASGNAKQTEKARAVKARRDTLRKSGKIADAAALLLDRM